jgi:hypothetical protein
MLADFQQAMADMVASPQLCNTVRRTPDTLWRRYTLSTLEYRRLVEIAGNHGMNGHCALYRVDRFAPLALHLPELCRGLREVLPMLVEEYWTEHPRTDVNALLECDRFCRFLRAKEAKGWAMPAELRTAFEHEHGEVQMKLALNCTIL